MPNSQRKNIYISFFRPWFFFEFNQQKKLSTLCYNICFHNNFAKLYLSLPGSYPDYLKVFGYCRTKLFWCWLVVCYSDGLTWEWTSRRREIYQSTNLRALELLPKQCHDSTAAHWGQNMAYSKDQNGRVPVQWQKVWTTQKRTKWEAKVICKSVLFFSFFLFEECHSFN